MSLFRTESNETLKSCAVMEYMKNASLLMRYTYMPFHTAVVLICMFLS